MKISIYCAALSVIQAIGGIEGQKAAAARTLSRCCDCGHRLHLAFCPAGNDGHSQETKQLESGAQRSP
jgi:hypothetical protein